MKLIDVVNQIGKEADVSPASARKVVTAFSNLIVSEVAKSKDKCFIPGVGFFVKKETTKGAPRILFRVAEAKPAKKSGI